MICAHPIYHLPLLGECRLDFAARLTPLEHLPLRNLARQILHSVSPFGSVIAES